MSQSSGIPLEELRPHMFLLRDRDATSHLMRHVLAPYRQAQDGGQGCARFLKLCVFYTESTSCETIP